MRELGHRGLGTNDLRGSQPQCGLRKEVDHRAFACLKEVFGKVAHDEELPPTTCRVHREADEVGDEAALAETVGALPLGDFELGDSQVRFEIEDPLRIVACRERGSLEELLALLQQQREGLGDYRGMDQRVEDTDAFADDQSGVNDRVIEVSVVRDMSGHYLVRAGQGGLEVADRSGQG